MWQMISEYNLEDIIYTRHVAGLTPRPLLAWLAYWHSDRELKTLKNAFPRTFALQSYQFCFRGDTLHQIETMNKGEILRGCLQSEQTGKMWERMHWDRTKWDVLDRINGMLCLALRRIKKQVFNNNNNNDWKAEKKNRNGGRMTCT